jgi:hypothetical protein
VAAALAVLATLLAGCAGVRSSSPAAAATGHSPGPHQVRLVISRDFGSTVITDVTAPAGDGLTVMRLLADHVTVDTGYGGRFVSGIDGLKSTFGAASTSATADWFYWVDGLLADVGASDYSLHGGETVWWDYHRWANSVFLPVALSGFPAPYDRGQVALSADGPWGGLPDWAVSRGLKLASARPLGGGQPDGGLVVATTEQASGTSWLRQRLAASSGSGVLVTIEGHALHLVSSTGATGPVTAAVAVPLSNATHAERPLMLLVGATRADVARLLPLLTTDNLRARIGVAIVGDRLVSLPWQSP